MANLLLHSLREFDEIIFALLEGARPASVLEIGSETGVFSQRLIEFATRTRGELLTVEPFPTKELQALAVESEHFHVYQTKSLPFLEACGCRSDFVIIDGDHNYFTVANELRLIEASWAARDAADPASAARAGDRVILLHDVLFPCGRRDTYYNPNDVPEADRHPFSFELGVTLGSREAIQGGFRGEGAFAVALHEGGPKNGVLTAVEDFIAAHPDYVYRSVDAVFGLGALTRRGTPADALVAQAFAPYDNALLRRLEENRMGLYLKVIELQDIMNRERAEHARERARAVAPSRVDEPQPAINGAGAARA